MNETRENYPLDLNPYFQIKFAMEEICIFYENFKLNILFELKHNTSVYCSRAIKPCRGQGISVTPSIASTSGRHFGDCLLTLKNELLFVHADSIMDSRKLHLTSDIRYLITVCQQIGI